jgi:hypothetical protein
MAFLFNDDKSKLEFQTGIPSDSANDFTETGKSLGTKSCGDSNPTKIGTVNLSEGTWLIIGVIKWVNTNTTGERLAALSTNQNYNNTDGVCVDLSGGEVYYTNNRVVRVVKNTSPTDYHLIAYQSSGTTLNASGWISCVRLR